MSLSISLKVSYHLTYSAAGIAFAKPGSNVCVVIIQRFQLLDIDQNHRNVQILHCRKHIVGCGVGQKLHKHQIYVCRAEQIARCLGLLLGGNHTAVDNLYGIGKCLFECLILGFEFRNQ